MVKQWIDINSLAPPSLFSHFGNTSWVHFSFTASIYLEKINHGLSKCPTSCATLLKSTSWFAFVAAFFKSSINSFCIVTSFLVPSLVRCPPTNLSKSYLSKAMSWALVKPAASFAIAKYGKGTHPGNTISTNISTFCLGHK